MNIYKSYLLKKKSSKILSFPQLHHNLCRDENTMSTTTQLMIPKPWFNTDFYDHYQMTVFHKNINKAYSYIK